jgi:hypothetical protein
MKDKQFQHLLTNKSEKELEQYIEFGKWNTDSVDLVPFMLSKALSAKFLIVQLDNDVKTMNEIKFFEHETSKKIEIRKELKLKKRLDFNTGWFTPSRKERDKGEDNVEEKSMILILKQGHYNFIDYEEFVKNFESKNAENKNKEQKRTSNNVYSTLPQLVLPFISDRATVEIKKSYKKCFTNREFNISFKTDFGIKSLVKPIQEKPKTTVEPLETYGAVYQMECTNCLTTGKNITYIGETGRKVETRVKEHLRKINPNTQKLNNENISQVQIHDFENHKKMESKWSISILKRAEKCQERKVYEAMLIRKMKPTLNKDQGLCIITI